MSEDRALEVRKVRQDVAARAAEAKAAGPVSVHAGKKPRSVEEAREYVQTAIAEVMLQPESLRRFRKLLRSKNERIAKEAWIEGLQLLVPAQKDSGGARPTQVIVNNHMARPPKDVTTVEVN